MDLGLDLGQRQCNDEVKKNLWMGIIRNFNRCGGMGYRFVGRKEGIRCGVKAMICKNRLWEKKNDLLGWIVCACHEI